MSRDWWMSKRYKEEHKIFDNKETAYEPLNLGNFVDASQASINKILKWANENEDKHRLADAYLASCQLCGSLRKDKWYWDRFVSMAHQLRDGLGREIQREWKRSQ